MSNPPHNTNFENLHIKPELKKPWIIHPGRHKLKDLLLEDFRIYNGAYLFTYEDMSKFVVTELFKTEWPDSKLWLSRVAQGALQNSKSPDLKKVGKAFTKGTALWLTNRSHIEVMRWFRSFSIWGYPLPGYQVDATIKLNKGPLPQFNPEIEPYLRELGMPTTVLNGAVMLTNDFEVCREGTLLTEEQVHFLELLGEKLSVFKFTLKARWSKKRGYRDIKSK